MLNITIAESTPISVGVLSDSIDIAVQPSTVISRKVDVYNGKTTVVPDTDAVILPTKEKLVMSDITVFKIPLWEVSNTEGGTTIYIGGER